MLTTGNLGLKKPEGTDTVNIDDFNYNADILDTQVKAVNDNANSRISSTLLGAVNGVAQLDSTGKVLSAQLPSFVDDVLEHTNLASFPATGETGKIYVALDTNKTYRWSGSAYVEISASLALGTTSATAFRGDYGNTAYAHSQAAHAPSNAQKNSDITKAEIEAKLTGLLTSHNHSTMTSIWTGDATASFTMTFPVIGVHDVFVLEFSYSTQTNVEKGMWLVTPLFLTVIDESMSGPTTNIRLWNKGSNSVWVYINSPWHLKRIWHHKNHFSGY